MTPHDEQRFAAMISDFVEGCKFARPFHLVCIDARGTASVTRYDLHFIGWLRQGGEDRDRGGGRQAPPA